ncbi:hypothetical protein PAUR_a0958 [Pseudoalteromonas aurantia 208]|uniref:Uncharacterized protein n=1 Tax=Pseudoalteromonas aurantia 208 TaxID=1314867 RepID=A0ABR9E9A1_9GAMM|nr:hypothetical protein [Pseudoalteromonas aurantia 208]
MAKPASETPIIMIRVILALLVDKKQPKSTFCQQVSRIIAM